MKSKKPEQKKPSDLRKRAEKKLKTKETLPKLMSDKVTRQLIHELQVHQIELEMQNEELRKAQAEVEESRTKYSDLYDFAPVGYFTFDKNGMILEANLTAAKELGIERGLLIKKPFRTHIIPEDRNIFDQHLQQVISNENRQTCEISLKRKDGTRFYAQLVSIATNDLKGNTLCKTSVIDITERKRAEEEMQKLASVVKHSNELVNLATLDGKMIFLNEAGGKMLGIDPGEVKQTNILQVIPDHLLDLVRTELLPELVEGRQWEGDLQYHNLKTNVLTDVRAITFTIKDPDTGKPLYLANISVDITERKRAEEKLIIQNKIAQIFLSIPDDEMYNEVLKVILEVMQSPSGIFGYLNKSGALIVPTMTRQIWDKCQVPEKTFTFPRDKWGHSTWPQAIRGKKTIYSNEPSTNIPQGHVSIQRHISLPILLQGEVIGLFQVANKETDYTEENIRLLEDIAVQVAPILGARLKRKQAEDAIKRTAVEWQTTFDSTKELFMLLDKDYKIIRTNKATREFLGMPFEKIIGNYCFKLIHGTDEPYPECPLARLMKSQSHEESEIFIKERNIWASVSVDPIFNEKGELVQVVHIIEDITDRKLAEEEIQKLNAELEQRVRGRTAQLEAANKELEAFSYSVSHDLRAPLRAIDGFTEILRREYSPHLDDEGKRICSIITGNSKKMGQLIDELLSLSRFSRADMRFSLIDMKALANEVYLELTTPEMQQRIDFQLSDLCNVSGDPTLIRQVWINLISNAIKFSSHREQAVISITCKKEKDQTEYCIKDNGAGFNIQYAGKLFGAFQRLHSEQEFEGTGVGLAIVQRIVRRHGGDIWAEGETDKGAAFFFSLPNETFT